MSKINWATITAYLVVLGFIAILFAVPVRAHDMDHPEEDSWYSALMQPDNPTVPCCGKADGYWCDGVHTRDGKNYCTISDDRIIPNRTPRPVGMEIEIPDNKMMDGHLSRGNPTGHSVVFLTSGEVPSVFCFVLDSGL